MEEVAGLTRLSLSQNSPNPFGLATRIVFTLPERLAVKLSVSSSQRRNLPDAVYARAGGSRQKPAVPKTRRTSGRRTIRVRSSWRSH